MTVKEIKEKIEQLKNRLILMNMIDRWTHEDRAMVNRIENELHELEAQIAQNRRKEVKEMKKPMTKAMAKRKAKAEKLLPQLKLNRDKLISDIACGNEEAIKVYELDGLNRVIEAQIELLSKINALYK